MSEPVLKGITGYTVFVLNVYAYHLWDSSEADLIDAFWTAWCVRQEFGMIKLESSGNDCPMGMSFRGKGVNPS